MKNIESIEKFLKTFPGKISIRKEDFFVVNYSHIDKFIKEKRTRKLDFIMDYTYVFDRLLSGYAIVIDYQKDIDMFYFSLNGAI